jgi:VWFA-related protein
MVRPVVRTVFAGACAGVLAGVLVWAQGPPAPPVQQRPPTFRGGAVLVTVDAYPQRDGKIVEGLTTADFEILEDGVPQAIENFEFVRIEPARGEAARRDPNTQQEAYALAADPHNRVFIVFLDVLHVTVEGSHGIRAPLVDTLNRIVAPNDLFGVMTQNTEPRHLVLGRRSLSVEEQLTKRWPWGERYRLRSDLTDPMETTLRACFEWLPNRREPTPWHVSDNGQRRFLYQVLIDRRREDRTLTSLESLVEHFAEFREARTVTLLVTDGWRLFGVDHALAGQASIYGPTIPTVGVQTGQLVLGDKSGITIPMSTCQAELARLSLLDNDRRLRDLIARANRANMSFYPVTPAGLAAFDTPISEKSRPSLVEDGNRLRARGSGLRTLAENTDGIAIVDTNDLKGGMRRIVDDVSAFYLLGYYSTNTTLDGKYRRIEVKLKPPGLHVRARRGYVAPTSTREPAARPADVVRIDDALAPLGRLRSDAPLFTRGTVDGNTVHVAVELSSRAAVAAPWRAGAEAQVVVTGLDGASLPAVTGRIEPGTRGALLSVPLAAAKLPVRVLARVSAGGEALDDSVELPAPLATAGVVGEAVIYRGRPAATSPLRPVADLQFYRSERVHVEWAIPGELEQRTARLLGRNGSPLAVPVTLTERERDGRRMLAADVRLAPLTAGDYVIELQAARGGATQQVLLAFRVIQ